VLSTFEVHVAYVPRNLDVSQVTPQTGIIRRTGRARQREPNLQIDPVHDALGADMHREGVVFRDDRPFRLLAERPMRPPKVSRSHFKQDVTRCMLRDSAPRLHPRKTENSL